MPADLPPDVPRVDLDLHAMEPHEVARLMVTRAFGDGIAWAEILHDANRYDRTAWVVAHLVHFCEQLLGVIGEQTDRSAEQVWRESMLLERTHKEQNP